MCLDRLAHSPCLLVPLSPCHRWAEDAMDFHGRADDGVEEFLADDFCHEVLFSLPGVVRILSNFSRLFVQFVKFMANSPP